MPRIEPAAAGHPGLAPFTTLRQKDAKVPDGCFIGDGRKVVRRMLAWPGRLRTVVVTERWLGELRAEIEKRPEPDLPVLVAGKDVVDGLIGYDVHQGVMALAELPAPATLTSLVQTDRPLLVALDGVADAENVGAIVRTCAAYDVAGLIVGPRTCSPWVRRAVRVSLGGVLRVPVHFSDDLPRTIGELKKRGVTTWSAHIHGESRSAWETDYRDATCLVLGGEADGVTQPVIAASAGVIYIPMAPGWDCLNVTASAASLIAEAARQRRSGMIPP